MNPLVLELDGPRGAAVFRALSSEVRLRILDLLAGNPMNIHALGQALGLSAPTVTHHIQTLERAGLVLTEYAQGIQGTQKLCVAQYDTLELTFENATLGRDEVEAIEMPVGHYTQARPSGTCGLASSERIIGFYDDAQSFFLPERIHARCLWMGGGFVEYVIPNRLPASTEIDRLELSLEMCSEAPETKQDYPSDITVWLNGVELGTWRSPGDLGDRRGRMFPAWWPARISQYGILTRWTVSRGGTYINDARISDVTLEAARIVGRKPITLRIGVKPDAECHGGFNLFGRGIGDHNHDILLKLFHAPVGGSAAAPMEPARPAHRRGS